MPGFFLCSSGYRREFGYAQCQPFGAMARKIDLGTGVITAALQGQHSAFAKLGVKNLLPQAQSVRRCLAHHLRVR